MTTIINAHPQNIVVLDFGSQYTKLIARRIREVGVLSLIMPGDSPMAEIFKTNPKALVLSGGPNSVHLPGSPQPPPELLSHCTQQKIPILGICYGMQLLVHTQGGSVRQGSSGGEYGRMPIKVEKNSKMFAHDPNACGRQVWMSHGDEADKLPEGFVATAHSENGVIVGIESESRMQYGLQYHPEVRHTDGGKELLHNFVSSIVHADGDWSMESVLQEQVDNVNSLVGPSDHVVCALSGGVDSAVAACLVHKALGDRLHCVMVDNGLLRLKEAERVMGMFKESLHLSVDLIDASQSTLGELEGVSDPERKRKIIGKAFIDAFKQYAASLESKLGQKPKYLVQGTLYPDVIESCPPPGSNQKHSHTIKSHHNVGGLPKDLGFTLIEPLRDLFKDEVRKLGALLQVPEQFIKRHPFPGPGLAVRVIGDIQQDKLEVLRQVDEIYINTIKEFGLYDEIWQAFSVFLPIRSVGVQGDQRTHCHVVALRAVTSSDGMTADWYPFKPDFLQTVSARICNQVQSVNRVVYDVTSKPPGTIEWE